MQSTNGIPAHGKVLSIDELIKKARHLQKAGNVVVQSHGIFDIIHPGITQHLKEAKDMGDILVITVIRDQDVRRGPGRPLFTDRFRSDNVASLETVDYVCIVNDEVPFSCVKRIAPDIFARGAGRKIRDHSIREKIFQEKMEDFFCKSTILETKGYALSSSHIINNFLDIFPEETKHFIREFSTRYSFDSIAEKIRAMKKLKLLLIGDGIVDEYHYCTPMGKSSKAQLVVNKFLTHELFPGGVFAIANHIAGICEDVTLVTLLGSENSQEDFVLKSLRPNIKTKFFYRKDGPTVVKKRYVDAYNNQKLFEINYLNDRLLPSKYESNIMQYLAKEIPRYDLVLVSDFGHGFISCRIIDVLEKASKKLAVNTQINAANRGFNMVTKYRQPDFVCLDEAETRLTMQSKYDDIDVVGEQLLNKIGAQLLVVTMGKSGSVGISKEEVQHTPIFSSKVVDTVGAGDAVFSFAAPCYALGMPLELITFIGNVAGAIAVQIVCNKRPVEVHELLEFVHTLMKGR